MQIRHSARKHGITDLDILHAVRHAVAGRRFDRAGALPRTLALGPDRAGNLLEVIVVHEDDGTDLVIHAMRMRPVYHDLLSRHGR